MQQQNSAARKKKQQTQVTHIKKEKQGDEYKTSATGSKKSIFEKNSSRIDIHIHRIWNTKSDIRI